jgi:hypothetical protein
MQDFWSEMNGFDLPASNHQELDDFGFTIITGPVPADDLAQLAATYDAAVSAAISDDIKVGSSTTRVRDFVNRDPESTGCTCIRQFSRLAVRSSADRSSSARCTLGQCGQDYRPRISMSITSATVAVGRWSVSYS